MLPSLKRRATDESNSDGNAQRDANRPGYHGAEHGAAAPGDPWRAAPAAGTRWRDRREGGAGHRLLHTGIEKTCEGLTWHQAITATDRTDYLAPLSNNLAYILAVEKLFGVTDQVPKRAQYLRVILTELTRLSSHLVWLGTHGLDLGATTVFLYCFRERRRLPRSTSSSPACV